MKLKLRGKFMLPSISLVLVGIILLLVLAVSGFMRTLKTNIKTQLLQTAHAKADQIEDWMARNQADIQYWGAQDIYRIALESGVIGKGARKSANNQLKRIQTDYPHFTGLRLTNSAGLVVASSNPKNVGKVNVADRDYFKKALAGEMARSKVLVSKTSGKPIFVLATPIKNGGQVRGVLYGVVNLSRFNETFIDVIRVGKTGYAFMVDENGMVLAHADKSKIAKANVSDQAFGKAMFAREAGFLEYAFGGDTKLAAFARMPTVGWRIAVTAPQSEVFASAVSLRNQLLLASGILVMLLCCGIWWMTERFVVRPVSTVANGLADIVSGEGDLTRRLDFKGHDEVAQLAGRFNAFMEIQQQMIVDIAGKAATLTESAGQLTTAASHMSEGSDQTSAKARNVAQSAGQMSTNMDSVAASTEQASANMSMVASSAEEMSATVAEIAQNSGKASNITGDAVDRVAVASTKVDELGKAAVEISKVTEVITEISEQTNLLALNATIEAARAGEAGKGFAVVANEIKELARQTAEATGEIKARIDGIQGSTSATVSEIEKIAEVITSVNEIVSSIAAAVEEQAVTTKNITENVNQTDQGIRQVNDSIAQSSTVSADIASEITLVDQAATEISNTSSQVNDSAQALTRLAKDLKEMVGRFKTSA